MPVHVASEPLQPIVDKREYPEQDNTDDIVDLIKLWRILVKHRWTILTAFSSFLFAGLVYTLLKTPIYRATVTIQIEREPTKVLSVGDVTPSDTNDSGYGFYHTQYELLRSRALAERVADQPGLIDEMMVARLTKPSPMQRLIAAVSSIFTDGKVSATQPLAGVQREARTDLLSGSMTVEPLRDSHLVRLHYDSPDPALSARAANAYAQAYIELNLERRMDATSYAKTYLEDGLQRLQLKLQESEKRLVGFAEQEGIVNVQDKTPLLTEQLQQINSALAVAESDRIKAQARYEELKSSDGDSTTEALQSDLMSNLKQDLATLEAEYENKLDIFKPSYPEMRSLSAKIRELKRQIKKAGADIKNNIDSEYRAASRKEKLLRTKLEGLKTASLDLDRRSIQYTMLKREVDTTRQLYDSLLQRYKEVGVAGGIGPNNISIVDSARIPHTPFSPSLAKNALYAAIIGLFLGYLIAFLRERYDDTVNSPEDVEKFLGLAVLGVIPKLKMREPALEIQEARSSFAEAYRSTRTALQFSTDMGVPQVLCITSISPGEGKTTSAVSLAYQFAQLRKRVLLIDADMRNPSVHKVLKVSNEIGLSNCLTGATKYSDAILPSGMPGVSCILSGPIPPNPAELLASSRLLDLLSFARERYDLVLVDSPPVLGISDAPMLGNAITSTLVVVQAAGPRVTNIRIGLRRLEMARAHLLGVLLTKFNAREAGYIRADYYYGEKYSSYRLR